MSLELKLKDLKTGKEKIYTQNWFSVRKVLELMDLTEENYPELDSAGWLQKNTEWAASLFDNPEVTADAILDGLDNNSFNEFFENAQNQVLGIDPKKVTEKK